MLTSEQTNELEADILLSYKGHGVTCSRFNSFIFVLVLPQNCFELFIPNHKDQVIKACKTEADGRVVEGNHTFYRISAPTAEEKEEWIKSIK